MTLVRAIVAKALRDAGTFNAGANFAPAAVLWADPERTWEPVIRSLQEAVPILVLGEYDPATAQGPALWLRAVLASPESANLPSHLAGREEHNPWVIYLPGISRSSVAEASAPHGNGVRGMKDRARLAGGWLTAGASDTDGGFVVTLFVPTGSEKSAAEDDAA